MATQDLEAFLGPPPASMKRQQTMSQGNMSLDDFLGEPPKPSMTDRIRSNMLNSKGQIGFDSQTSPMFANSPTLGTLADIGAGMGNFMASVPVGALQGASDIASGLQAGATYLHNQLPYTKSVEVPEQAPQFSQYAPSELGELTGEIGFGLASPQLAGAKVAGLASKIPGIGKAIAPYVPTAVTGGAYGGLYGAGNPNSSLSGDISMGAALPVGLQAVGRGLAPMLGYLPNRGLNKLQETAEQEKAAGMNDRTLTPQEAAANIQTAREQGTSPTLGQVANNAQLNKNYEHVSYLPLASQRKQSGEFLGQIERFANDIYDNLFGGIDALQVNPTILSGVQKVLDDNRAVSKSSYDNIAALADHAGIVPDRSPIQQYAQKQIKNLNARTKANVINLLKHEHSTVDILQTVSKPVGKEFPYSFSTMKEERSAVGELRDQLEDSSPKSTTAINFLGNLYGRYTDAMGHALDNTPIKSVWQKANDFHRDNVAPFRKGKLPYILNNGQHEKIVPELLNNSAYQSVVKMLPPETRKLILGSKLMGNASELEQKLGENGEVLTTTHITPYKLGSSYKNMNTKKNPNIQALTQGLTHNINGNKQPIQIALQKLNDLNIMANPIRKIAREPPTGYVTKAAAAGGAPAALAMGSAIAGGMSALPALGLASGATVGAGMLGKLRTNYLKNPDILNAYANPAQRKAIIEKLIRSKLPPLPDNVRNLNYPAGIAALLNQGNP